MEEAGERDPSIEINVKELSWQRDWKIPYLASWPSCNMQSRREKGQQAVDGLRRVKGLLTQRFSVHLRSSPTH